MAQLECSLRKRSIHSQFYFHFRIVPGFSQPGYFNMICMIIVIIQISGVITFWNFNRCNFCRPEQLFILFPISLKDYRSADTNMIPLNDFYITFAYRFFSGIFQSVIFFRVIASFYHLLASKLADFVFIQINTMITALLSKLFHNIKVI